jgi:uncharacterized protein YggU (UPF0235/DUF167 family)
MAQGPAQTEICVKVQTRTSRAGVSPEAAGEWGVRVTAPLVEGAANRAVIAVVAGAVGVAPSCVELVSGARSHHKRLRITGVTAPQAQERLWAASQAG